MLGIVIAVVVIGCGLVYYFMGSGYNYGPQYTAVPQSTDQILQPTSTPAVRSTDVMAGNNPANGKIFVDGNGMTLYTFSKDTPGVSTCYDVCATNWPALQVSAFPKIGSSLIPGKFSVITRTDGTKQVAFEGMPLYYYVKDVKPGDINGQGVGGVWSIYRIAPDDFMVATPNPAGSAY